MPEKGFWDLSRAQQDFLLSITSVQERHPQRVRETIERLLPAPRPDCLAVRYWHVLPGGVLESPVMGVSWASSVLCADRYNPDIEKTDGAAGIHALHPPRLARAVKPESREEILRASWDMLDRYRRPSAYMAAGLVRPYGRVVVGTLGLRAERMEILALLADAPGTARALRTRYSVPAYVL